MTLERVERRKRYETESFNRYREMCFIVCVLSVVTAVSITLLVVSNSIHLCSNDAACEASKCQKAECRGICVVEPIQNCCTSDDECPDSTCQVGKCGSDNQCYILPLNGISCDDGSECTEKDTCSNGICVGIEKEKQCSKCVGGVFVPDTSQDHQPCSDGSKCTVHDECHLGECEGTPITCPNGTCTRGVCDPEVGCVDMVVEDTSIIVDQCTTGKCTSGRYSETFKDCFDGNPCTLDACFPASGACVHPLSNELCETVCREDSDCHPIGTNADYVCWDGMCADVTSSEMIIRMTHGELETTTCPENHARLQMRFFMDGVVDNGIMFVPMTESITPIYPPLTAFDVETNYLYDNSGIRTYFSMKTGCRDLTEDCFPFINGEYEFKVKRYPCTNVHGTHCEMDNPMQTLVMVPFSIYSCPLNGVALIEVVPELHIQRSGYTVTSTVAFEDQNVWLTDVVVCIPNPAAMHDCITNEAEKCPYRGCFDTPHEYLEAKFTFLSNSSYTAAATTSSSIFHVKLKDGYEEYAGDKCTAPKVMDWISFSLLPLKDLYNGRIAVIDMKYTIPLCSSRRLSTSEIPRQIATTVI